jgi:hypothetical protein
MTTTALELVLQDQAQDSSVRGTAAGCEITATTAGRFQTPGDASDAAYDLLHELLSLGYRLRGGLVGAKPTADGYWRGELAEVFLAQAGRTAAYRSAA